MRMGDERLKRTYTVPKLGHTVIEHLVFRDLSFFAIYHSKLVGTDHHLPL